MEEMTEVEIKCGCTFKVPTSISDDMEASEGYLLDHHLLTIKQVGVSQFNVCCSKCHSIVAKDI